MKRGRAYCFGQRPAYQSSSAKFLRLSKAYLTPPPPGGFNGIGAPSSATASVGTMTAVHVQNRPTIRINTLNARFIGFFLLVRVPWERKPSCARNYTGHVKGYYNTRPERTIPAQALLPLSSLRNRSLPYYFQWDIRLAPGMNRDRNGIRRTDSDCLRMRQIKGNRRKVSDWIAVEAMAAGIANRQRAV